MISQIENEVNAELRKIHDSDIIELELPQKAKGKRRDKIFETIHDIFNAEIVDNKLFIKVRYNFCFAVILHFLILLLLFKLDGGPKMEVHKKLMNSLDQQLPTWWNQLDTTCMVNGNQYRPDVGGWKPKPALDQRAHPIINPCPPPLLWILNPLSLELCN